MTSSPDTSSLDPLILDFLEWIARKPRSYAEVMETWRTSCPRLTVWEDAMDRGFVMRQAIRGQSPQIELTPAGRAFLASRSESRIPADAPPLQRIHSHRS